MADDKIFIGDLPLAESAEGTDSLIAFIDNKAQRIHIEDVSNSETQWEDIIGKPFTNLDGVKFSVVAGDEGVRTITLSDYMVTQDSLANITNPINTEIGNIKTYVSYSSPYKNENLYNALSTVTGKIGYNLVPTQDSSTGNWTLQVNKNGAPYDPTEQYSWFFALSSGLTTTVPQWNSSNNQWNFSMPSENVLMSSYYVQALKKQMFDNTWTSGRSYAVGAVVVQEGSFYKCKTANSDTTFNSSHWDAIGGGGVSGLPTDVWYGVYEGVLNGIARAFDVNQSWMGKGSCDYDEDTALGYKDNYVYWDTSGNEPYAYEVNKFYDDTKQLDIRRSLLEMLTNMVNVYPAFKTWKDSGYDIDSWSYSAEVYQAYTYKRTTRTGNLEYNSDTDFVQALSNLFGAGESHTYVVKGKYAASDWVGVDGIYSSLDPSPFVRKCSLTVTFLPTEVDFKYQDTQQPFIYDYERYVDLSSGNRITNGTMLPFNSKIKKVTMMCDSDNAEIKMWYNRILATSVETHQAPPDMTSPDDYGWAGTYAIMSANYVPDIDIPIKLMVEI